MGEPMSSSTHVPVNQSDGTQTICGQSSDAKDGRYYEFQWHHAWMRVRKNSNGTTGWGTIIHSTNPVCRPRTQCRIHLCASKPCQANHPASKYGNFAPPMHLHEVQKQIQISAVAEPSDSQLPLPAAVQTAVAGPSSEALPLAAEPAPVGPAHVVESAAVEEPSVVLEPAISDYPKEAALSNMKPPAPAAPLHVDSQGVANATQSAITAVASPAVAAQHTIHTAMLALAREIRRPRAYVGYSAFILMGVLKKCQPCVWEGGFFLDLLDVFAPWAKENCTAPLPVTAVSCALMAQAGGCVELVPISADYPLSKTTHFVAGMRVPECLVVGSSCSFETLYASLGVAVVPTVLDGDCALDSRL